MSSESSDNGTSPVKGPRVNTGGVQTLAQYDNHLTGSSGGFGQLDRDWSYRRFLGGQYDSDRQLYDVLGYEEDLKIGHYVAKYERGPGVATGLVDKPVHDSWRGEWEVTESEDSEDDETEFEEQARKFLEGEYTRLPPAARFRAADRWARLLEFSLILVGVNDDGLEEGNADSLANEVAVDSLESMDDLNYLAVYDQRRVNWEETEKVDDPTNPRYRLPETYNIEVAEDENVDVHHSRIIHVVEEPDEDELRSTPIYKPIYNRLDDLQKLHGGSAEMFWRSAYPGLVLTPPTDADGVPMKFDDDGDSIAEQIKEYRHNLNRLHRVTGDLEKLDTEVANPDPQISVQYQDISAYIDMPMSIIRGNETGERATSEDLEMYHEFIAGRQSEHCVGQFLRPVFDTFIDWGMMTSPQSGDDDESSYEIEPPTLEEPTEKERAETAHLWAQALSKMSGGNPNALANAGERRQLIDMDPEYGSEAPDAADPEELVAENLEVPESPEDFEEVPGQGQQDGGNAADEGPDGGGET